MTTNGDLRPLTKQPELSQVTIGSIAIVAYGLANVLHEGLGHGGACLLMHVKPTALNAIFLRYDDRTVSEFGQRVIAAGGPIMNLLTGGAALAGLRLSQSRGGSFRYFLWLFSSVSLLQAFGYPLFSGIVGTGDWNTIFVHLAPAAVVRGGLILVGAFLYFVLAPKLLIPGLVPFLAKSESMELQVRRLMRLPYFVGGTLFVAAGLLNPYGLKVMLISAAAASFGATSLLAWGKVPESAFALAASSTPDKPQAERGWIAAAALTLIIFVGILGRGITF